MTHFPDIAITLEFGSRRRRVSLGALAEALASSDIRGALCRLVLGKEGDYRGSEGVPNDSDNGFIHSQGNNTTSFSSALDSSEGDGGCRGEEVIHTLDRVRAELAEALTRAFADRRSSRFYRLVVERVPMGVIREALQSAFELTPRELRRSRAAYFTACVMPVIEASRTKARN